MDSLITGDLVVATTGLPLAALLAGAASIAAARAVAAVASTDIGAFTQTRRWVIYLWPFLAAAPLVLVIFAWSPGAGSFPSLEFYRVAAEVMPLLLIALLVEQDLVNRLPRGIRLEFVLVLLAAETAAFIGVSEIFGDAPLVGGSRGWTGVVATVTGLGLLAGALLIVAAALVRDRPASGSGGAPVTERPVVSPEEAVSAKEPAGASRRSRPRRSVE